MIRKLRTIAGLPHPNNHKPWVSGKETLARLVSCALMVLCTVGCRSRAHQDLYRAKLASQIRVLEDQLYDADYQNRILRDELERARQLNGTSSFPPRKGSLNPPNISGKGTSVDASSGKTIMAPSIDSSLPAPADPKKLDQPALGDPFIDDPVDDSQPSLPEPPQLGVGDDKKDVKPEGDEKTPLKDPPESIPSPKGIEKIPVPIPLPDDELKPPTNRQLDFEKIQRGELLPPKLDGDGPGGKIEIPPGSRSLQYESPSINPIGTPERLELHQALSGGHQFDSDDEIDGLYLVITVVDDNGRTLSLDQFDVDADMSVVVLDPDDTSDDARVGRWDFTPQEVRGFIRSTPVDGLHIPIAWQDRSPSGKDVIVHIKMMADDEEMRCQGRLKLEESVANSKWLPRG